MRNYLVEFIGTFFLVFTVGSAVLIQPQGMIPAIAIGFALMIMVYAGGPISGGHYNPAVSLAAAIRGALPAKELIPYMIAQVIGGIAAISIVRHMIVPYAQIPGSEFHVPSLVIGEFLFTFALCYVVLLTATSKKTEGNSYFGLAIGSTVTVGAFAVGSFCLAALNPAVAISLGVVAVATWKIVAITVGTNLLAGAAAAGIFKAVYQEE